MTNELTPTTNSATPETTATPRARTIYKPLADIVETREGISLMLEMPGVAPEDVDVTLDKRELTIRGRVLAAPPEKLQLTYREYGEGDFERVFALSEDFDPARIEAQMRHGILTLTLPRAAEAQPRKIVVKGA